MKDQESWRQNDPFSRFRQGQEAPRGDGWEEERRRNFQKWQEEEAVRRRTVGKLHSELDLRMRRIFFTILFWLLFLNLFSYATPPRACPEYERGCRCQKCMERSRWLEVREAGR